MYNCIVITIMKLMSNFGWYLEHAFMFKYVCMCVFTYMCTCRVHMYLCTYVDYVRTYVKLLMCMFVSIRYLIICHDFKAFDHDITMIRSKRFVIHALLYGCKQYL